MSSSRVSPVQRLPAELLCLVLQFAAFFDGPSPFTLRAELGYIYEDTPAILVPLAAAKVCRQWRCVALSTPSLWSALHFSHPSHIDRARVFLSRTVPNITPVHILIETVSLTDYDPEYNLHVSEFQRIYYDLLCDVVPRWMSFHLRVSCDKCKLFARQALSTCGPGKTLHMLQLYHFEDFRTPESLHHATYRRPVPVFDNCLPNLRHVSMVGVNLRWEESVFLSHLSSLELALHTNAVRPIWSTWSNMLLACPQLQRLCLHYSGPRHPTPSDTEDTSWPDVSEANDKMVVLPALTELYLLDLDPEYLHSLLLRLSLPSLEYLVMDLADQDFTEVVQLLSRPTTSESESQPTVASSLDSHHISDPAMNPRKLKHLNIRALECSLSSWSDFVKKMTALKVIEFNLVKKNSKVEFLDCLGLGITVGSSSQAGSNVAEQMASTSHRRSPPQAALNQPTHTPRWKGKGKELEEDVLDHGSTAPMLPSLEMVKVRVKEGMKKDGVTRSGVKIVWEEENAEVDSDSDEEVDDCTGSDTDTDDDAGA